MSKEIFAPHFILSRWGLGMIFSLAKFQIWNIGKELSDGPHAQIDLEHRTSGKCVFKNQDVRIVGLLE